VLDYNAAELRAALEWAIEHRETDLALQLAATRFNPHVGGNFHWSTVASAHAQRSLVLQAIDLPGGHATHRVRALITAASLASVGADHRQGNELAQAALALALEHDDVPGIGAASFVLGLAAFHQGEVEISRKHLTEALARFRAVGAPGRIAWTLHYLGSLHIRIALDEGGDEAELARGVALFEEALATFRAAGHSTGVSRALHGLAYATYKQRDLERSLQLTRDVLAMDWELRREVHYYLEDIADIAGRMNAPALAARLYGAATAQRARSGKRLEPVFEVEYEADLSISRELLGDEAFQIEWQAGHEMPLAVAVEEALQFAIADHPVPPARATQTDLVLSPREIDVLRLIASGRSDREIAEDLFISRRTVSKHVESIFKKLRVHTRTAAVTEAVRRGLPEISAGLS
jgi:DNA-binding CsgD family transcriptional regulator